MRRFTALFITIFVFIFMTLTVSAASTAVGPGGDVYDAQSLLEALGGESAGWVNDNGEVCLRSDVELEGVINFKDGEVYVNGASCIISGDGTLFNITGGKLILCQNDNTDNDETIIFEGKGQGSLFNIDGGRLEIYAGTLIEGGKAGDGGAVKVNSGELLLSGGLITGCEAENNGGAIAVYGGSAEFAGGKITASKAVNGGALYVSGGEITLSGTTFGSDVITSETSSDTYVTEEEGNVATNGGGIYLSGGEYGIYGITVAANTAEQGGGIYVDENTTIALLGGEIYYNTADYGGGIYTNGIIVDGSAVIAYNDALNGGGFLVSSGELYLAGGYVNSNTAQYGGGVFNYAYVEMSDGDLNYNSASLYGGGIYNVGEVIISEGSTGYNKIKNEDESYVGWGADILNYGKLTLTNAAFFGGEGDIAVVNTVEERNQGKYENNAIILTGPFTCTTKISRIVPVACDGENFVPAYEKGTQLLVTSDEEGETSGMKYYTTLFDVPDDSTGGAWVIGNNGCLKTAPFGVWVWAAIAGAAVIIVGGIVLTVKVRKTK